MKIAFTGAGGTGKTTYAKFVEQELLQLPGYIGSSTRKVADLFGWNLSTEFPDNDEVQLYSQFQRRLWLQEKKGIEVVSERCGLDEIVYQKVRVDRLQKKVSSPPLALPGGGNTIVTDDQLQLHLAGAVFQVLLQQGIDEAVNYWDMVYYCPEWSESPPDDGQRPTDKEYHREVVEGFKWLINTFPQLTPKIQRLPQDMKEAKKFLESESKKWRQ